MRVVRHVRIGRRPRAQVHRRGSGESRPMKAAAAKRAAHAQELPRSYVSSPPDTWLFIAVTSLVAIGLVMIFSASSAQAYADHHDTAYYVKRQAIYLVVGLILAYGA